MRFSYTLLSAILYVCLSSISARAATYTTIKSGYYSDPSIWQGGVAPHPHIEADEVNITNGVTVYMSTSMIVRYDGSLNIQSGSLIALGNQILYLQGPKNFYAYNATIYANRVYMYSGTYSAPQSVIAAEKFRFYGGNLLGKVLIRAKDELSFLDGKTYVENGTFEWIQDSTSTAKKVITFNNGILNQSSNFTNNASSFYTISYKDTINTVGGFEMNSPVEYDVVIDIADSNKHHIKLGTDVYIPKELALANCVLDLNGHILTFGKESKFTRIASFPPRENWAVIAGSATSGIILNKQIDLAFQPGKDTLGKLEVNYNYYSWISNYNASGHIYIADSLILKSGILNTNITIGPHAKTVGASVHSFVNGEVSTLLPEYGSYFYPIGSAKYPAYYGPVRIVSNSPTPINITISAEKDIHNLFLIDLSASRLAGAWSIDIDTGVNYNIDVEPFWSSDMELSAFDHAVSVFTTTNDGTDLKRYAPQAAQLNPNGMYSIVQKNITDMHKHFTILDTSTQATSVHTISKNKTIILHPNPATDVVNIQLSDIKATTGSIVDVSGRVVKTVILHKGNNRISIAELNAGIYFIKIDTDHTSSTAQFVKQ